MYVSYRTGRTKGGYIPIRVNRKPAVASDDETALLSSVSGGAHLRQESTRIKERLWEL